jgi:hypothetical protein
MPVPPQYQTAVDHLRHYGAAAETDVFNGEMFWTDDQLFTILERATEYRLIGLVPVNFARTQFKFNLPDTYWIKSEFIEIEGTDVSYTYDADSRIITFASEVTVTPYLNAPFFHMNHALANLWEQKTNQRFELIRIKAGANQMFMEQEYEHSKSRFEYYRARSVKRFKR